jgi:hypothetical protein
VRDVVTTKLFRNGGSFAVRIPAGWVDPEAEVNLVRDRVTGRIYLNQQSEFNPNEFFDFVAGRGYQPDDELLTLADRSDAARPSPFAEG